MSAENRGAVLHVAIDLGASGGRVAIGAVQGGRVGVEVIHRFPNGPVWTPTGLYWDMLGLWREILHGLKLAGDRARTLRRPVASIGVDSWAIDYALLDQHGLIMDGVHCYRDPRTDGVMESAFETMMPNLIYEQTGLQFLPFNTLYQLIALKKSAPGLLEKARTFLMVPDLINYWLTGQIGCERTNASTTQFYDPRSRDWAHGVLEAFGIPERILPPIIEPASVIGELRATVAHEVGLEGPNDEPVLVVAPGTHDTASAVAAVPLGDGHAAYISSGTWSLVGLETLAPFITTQALEADLTNEAGIHGTNRLLKNVMGLWILQECRHAWNDTAFADLYKAAEGAPPFASLIDPDNPRFLAPGADMPERVRAFCRETDQRVPESYASITRSVLESLALKYRTIIERLERVTNRGIQTIHIVGGGAMVSLLNQMTANATGRTVIAGPVDATLLGNLLVQAEALEVLGMDERRGVVRRSFELKTYTPKDAPLWEQAYGRFRSL